MKSIKLLKSHIECNDCINQIGGSINLSEINTTIFKPINSAFKKFLQEFSYEPTQKYNDSTLFFLSHYNDFKLFVESLLNELTNIKIQFCFQVNFI